MGTRSVKYNDEFKKSLVSMYKNGKSQSQLAREYGVSLSALSRWIKLFSKVKPDDETIISAKQIRELQKRNAALEEENTILKKPASRHTQATFRRCLYTASDKRLGVKKIKKRLEVEYGINSSVGRVYRLKCLLKRLLYAVTEKIIEILEIKFLTVNLSLRLQI